MCCSVVVIVILIGSHILFSRYIKCFISLSKENLAFFEGILKSLGTLVSIILCVFLGLKAFEGNPSEKQKTAIRVVFICFILLTLWLGYLRITPAPLESECARTTATPGPKASPVSASTPSPSWPPPELIAATIEALGQFDEFSDPDKIQNIIALEPALDACEKHIRYNIGSQADLCEEVVQQLQRCPDDKGAGVVTLLRALVRRHQGDGRASALENLAQEWERTP